MKLSNTTKRLLSENKGFQGQLADVFQVSIPTIWRWIKNDDIRLTTKVAEEFYINTMGILKRDVFEPTKQTKQKTAA